MKKLIRKILNEEIHPDYEGVIEEHEAYFKPTMSELKIGLLAVDEMGGYINKSHDWGVNWVNRFKSVLEKTYAIHDNELLARMILIFYFNSVGEIEDALMEKSTEGLYIGPFYECTIDYNDDDVSEDEESVDCEYCNGYGHETEVCHDCDGSGEVEVEEDEWETCGDCGGDGEIEDECSYCGGDGQVTEEVYELSQYNVSIITKEPFDETDYEYFSEVTRRDDILIGNSDWYNSERDNDGDWLERDADTIIDVNGEDILSNKSAGYILAFFR
jgi:hypothetical protein